MKASGVTPQHLCACPGEAIDLVSVLDALGCRVAIAGHDGRIVFANQAWQRHAGAYTATAAPHQCLLDSVAQALGADQVDTATIVAGIRAVLAGDEATFSHEFVSAAGWQIARVTRVAGGLPARAVITVDGSPGPVSPRTGVTADINELRQTQVELEMRARQLRELAKASLALNATFTLDELASIVTEHARSLIGAHLAVTSLTINHDWAQVITSVSLSDRYAAWRDYDAPPDGSGIYRLVCEHNQPMRLTQAELERHPAWRNFGAAVTEHMPLRGWLAVPLVGRDGANLGLIQLSDKDDGEFTETDESLLIQLAQLASVAIDNARLYTNAETARREYQMLVEQVPVVTYREVFDPTSDHSSGMYFSPQVETLLGYPLHEWTNKARWASLIHPDDYERVMLADDEADQTSGLFSVDYRLIARDGRIIYVHDEARLVHNAEGRPVSWQGVFVDVTAMREAEEALRRSEARFRSAFDDASVAMALMDVDGCYLRVNAAYCEMLGYSEADLLALHSVDLTHPDDRYLHLPHARRLVAGEIGSFQVEKRYLDRNGDVVWAILNLSRVRGSDDQPYFLAQMQDITEQKRLEAQLRHDALHDTLTSLPNRALLLDRLEQSLVQSRRHGRTTGVLFLDLDNFKVVNDSLGHGEGDRLLVDVAARISGCIRAGDTVSRFGGDEFVVLLPDLDDVAGAVEVADRIGQAFAAPFRLAGRDVSITISTGIVISESPNDTPDDLLRHADVAMYRAKHLGKNRYDLFDADMHAASLRRLQMEEELRAAIDGDRLRLVYQPKMSLATGEVVGCEALVRWHDPERGLIPPAEFIPFAEESGLIVQVGAWVVREAARQAAAWRLAGRLGDQPTTPPFMISVNLSARQFQQPDLIDLIAAVLAESGLPPGQLMLELTETVVMDDAEISIERLRRLKELGVQIAIDDFGTGYSSLAYLRRFPVDVIKIDQSFVDGLGRELEARAIVEATIGLAHTLGILVVAEGVETEVQLQQLRDLGCDLAQGYLFAPPLGPNQFVAFLAGE